MKLISFLLRLNYIHQSSEPLNSDLIVLGVSSKGRYLFTNNSLLWIGYHLLLLRTSHDAALELEKDDLMLSWRLGVCIRCVVKFRTHKWWLSKGRFWLCSYLSEATLNKAELASERYHSSVITARDCASAGGVGFYSFQTPVFVRHLCNKCTKAWFAATVGQSVRYSTILDKFWQWFCCFELNIHPKPPHRSNMVATDIRKAARERARDQCYLSIFESTCSSENLQMDRSPDLTNTPSFGCLSQIDTSSAIERNRFSAVWKTDISKMTSSMAYI